MLPGHFCFLFFKIGKVLPGQPRETDELSFEDGLHHSPPAASTQHSTAFENYLRHLNQEHSSRFVRQVWEASWLERGIKITQPYGYRIRPDT